jgi:spore coat polysaccharide biosynthesis predicted glycosyltransferase SpsG
LKFQDKVKIYQKDNVLDVISKHDLVIGYGGSSVVLYAICLHKPIILLKFFYNDTKIEKTRFHLDGVTQECKTLKEYQNLIENPKNIIDNYSSQNFLDHFMGNFDGKSSKRIADGIESLLNGKPVK